MPKIFWILFFLLSYWLGSSLVGHKFEGNYIVSDGEGYYLYLPALFIHGTFENMPVTSTWEFSPYPGTNKVKTRFTYGVALMESPFFGMAQLLRKIQGLKTNEPFASQISMMLLVSACFYGTFGLYFVYKTLSRHFLNKQTIFWTLSVLYFGTNLMFYIVREPYMSHVYSFFVVSVLVYVLPTFWRTPSVINTILVGFLIALITLIRPSNFVFTLFILLYDVYNLSDLKNRILHIVQNIKTLWFIPFIALLLAIPQMMYWHYLSGKWVLNIYKDIHHQSFTFWDNPKIYNIFLHPCCGFLLYTPLMWFTLVGMGWMALKNQLNGRLIGGVFLIFLYLYASWCIWGLGHTFSYRGFIDYYPLMVFGLAFYIDELLKSKIKWFKYINFTIFIALMIINLRFTIIPFYWPIEPDGANIENFWKALNWVLDFTKWN
jgi:hypothetical protein